MQKGLIATFMVALMLITFLSAVVGVNAISINNKFSSTPILIGKTIFVDDNAPSSWYDKTHVKTIKEGINNASDGDTVFVHIGRYKENKISVGKRLKIIGENRELTVIDKRYNIFDVTHNFVTIQNFTIKSYGEPLVDFWTINLRAGQCTFSGNHIIIDNDKHSGETGIRIFSSRNTIKNNIITSCDIGIYLRNTYLFNTIQMNQLENNGIGIYLDRGPMLTKIKENNFVDNQQHAYFYETSITSWTSNYWDDWYGLIPYIIHGHVLGGFPPEPVDVEQYDWTPAEEPYDIPDISNINDIVRTTGNPLLHMFPLLNLLLQGLKI